MVEIITYSNGIIYWTKEKMDSDEFILFCLEQYLGHNVSEIRVVREGGRKPRLSAPATEFSLTHTEGLLAVAFAQIPVGLDAENLRRPRKNVAYSEVTKRAFGIETSSDEDFFHLWTKKEALAKKVGVSIAAAKTIDGEVLYFTCGDILLAVTAD